MKPDPSPLRQTARHEVEAETVAENLHQQAGVEFESAEALLKQDRAQTVVPGRLAQRVAESVGNPASAPSSAPWWRRIF